MNALDLDSWIREQNHVTPELVRQALGMKHVGGSTWIQVSRMLVYHGFERTLTGWERKRPSPAAPCPTYRQLQKSAADRRARCRAALLKEKPKDPTVYDPVHRDPTVQDPAWSERGRLAGKR